MNDKNFCKSCKSSVHLTEDEMDLIFGKNAKVNNVKLISEDLYKTRINTCHNCDGFIYNSTCKYCGCIITIKAKFEAGKCSYPFNPKW